LWGFALTGIAGVASLAIALVYLTLYVGHTSNLAISLAAHPQTPSSMPYGYSQPQAELIDVLGPPDSFAILFYTEEGNDIRHETWRYYDDGREIVFVNGEIILDEAVDYQAGDFSPTPYGPHQFAADMSLADALASAGIGSYLRRPIDDAIVVGGDVIYARQLALGLKNGRLLSVEAMSLGKAS